MYGDGVFRYRDGISVAQVVTFSILILFAECFRRTRRIGWISIGIFSIIRLTSASCYLAIMKNDSKSLWATVFVCESLGIMLIIFLLLELLHGVNQIVHVVHKRYFLVPQILTWIDIIISIVGYVAVKNKSHNQLNPTPFDQASRAIVTAIYVYTLGLLYLFWRQQHRYSLAEKRAVRCVVYCIPLMIVRLVYSLIFEATGDRTFNSSKGDPTAYLLMTYLPELSIMVICTATIMVLPPFKMEEKKALEVGRVELEETRGENESDSGSPSKIVPK